MRRQGTRLIILCEDDEHEQFARHTFLALGYHPREMRVVPRCAGRGAAEQWVREQYALEVRAHRRKASSQNIGLIVVIDADTSTVAKRHGQLNAHLKENNLENRGPRECIVIWVPKRHIETWIAWLSNHKVDESRDCKDLTRGADYRACAARFVHIYRDTDGRPEGLLPAMSHAFDEMKRLPAC